jgi:predicted GNAT family acetyltransferase
MRISMGRLSRLLVVLGHIHPDGWVGIDGGGGGLVWVLAGVEREMVGMTVQVVRNDEMRRYEGRVDGVLAGFAEYQLTDELIVFTHTEVDPAFEGQGVGSAIAREALDDVRAGGTRTVLPLCPFISGWIARHQDYADLVYGAPPSTARD